MKIYNSLTRKIEEFEPINPPNVSMYTCGPTVYSFAHIGHGRKYVYDDILRRALVLFGFKVKHVQNVTDVGHLTSDADSGEDKMEKGAKEAGKTVWEVAEFYTKDFYESMDKLNILRPDIICRATEHIKEQIALIEKLFKNGYAYDTPEAVYFDISKFADYGKLFGQNLEEKKVAARQEVQEGQYKKHPADFALWFKRVGKFANHTMHWDSPWGDGFPGWHIECSAMSMKYLGEQFDIHTGGLDHLSVHHPNEIAQSEGATGKVPFVRYWIHHGMLLSGGKKMAKSLGNFYTIADVADKGIDPLALRYLFLTVGHRDVLNFTWEALEAAQVALNRLKNQIANFKGEKERTALSPEKLAKIEEYKKKFDEAIGDDLNTPQALAVVWEVVKSNIPGFDKYDLVMSFDEVLGLRLGKGQSGQAEIPESVKALMEERDKLRAEGKFAEADKIRKEIEHLGFTVQDAKLRH